MFKLDTSGNVTALHNFNGGTDGAGPWAGLLRDPEGNLYGTTYGGGTYGYGTVFQVAPNEEEKVLYSFTGGADGADPFGNLIADSNGNLYGTTPGGGAFGPGTVFKLDKTGTETVLYSFSGKADGADPNGGLVRDSAGNLYGTTVYGGRLPCLSNVGCGTVFKVDTAGHETVLHAFGGLDGALPMDTLIIDKAADSMGQHTGAAVAEGWVVESCSSSSLDGRSQKRPSIDGTEM